LNLSGSFLITLRWPTPPASFWLGLPVPFNSGAEELARIDRREAEEKGLALDVPYPAGTPERFYPGPPAFSVRSVTGVSRPE
jgi:hypothetical protein